ncbi:DNA polymerase V [Cyberlindnera fabianii]|uniref:DNA polymerase V n=1 Tax=Cyberlindnera fabianii TaxID=36022 RepID=A0A1V2L8P9_CYBFA|nr:DNA polymerase V [Cyberlindnera fabianii]
MTVSRDHYFVLASDIEAERIKAAVGLINELNEANAEDEWEYALKRLIKGLSSSRASARLGFSTCLTELINIRISNGSLTVSKLLELINEHNKVTSSMNGKEERAALFGKLFGLQCVSNMNSGVFNRDGVDAEDFKLFIDNLIELSCTKSWIREPALFTVLGLLRSLTGKISDDLVIYIFEKLDENKLSLTTEGLAIFLAVPPQFRSTKLSSVEFKNTTWKHADPLHKSNLSLLTKVLKDISTGDEGEAEEGKSKKNSKQKGSWSPRLHFVWQLIVSELSTSSETEVIDEQVDNSKKRKKHSDKKNKKSKSSNSKAVVESDSLQISEFWKVVIDESFFSEKASHERKYWGFEIFGLFFQAVQPESVDSIFTQNFMRTLINQASEQSRMLNKIAKKTLTAITETCKIQPLKTVPVLQNILLGQYGALHFDRLTKSKTTEILLSTDAPNDALAKIFTSVLDRDNDDKDAKFKDQKWAIDQLLHLVRSKKAKIDKTSDLNWVDQILKSLVQKAYMSAKPASDEEQDEVMEDQEEEDEEEDPIVNFAQERLNSIISDVISVERADNQTWSYKTLSLLLSAIESGAEPIFKFDDELNTVKDKSLKILKKIRAKRESQHTDNSRLLVFELLFSMVTLQLFSGDAESVNTLQELQDYYYDTKKDDDEDYDKVIGIVEILLNFLSQKSSLLKKLSSIIWENWCDKVNGEDDFSDESMDDEQMMAIDGQLAKIFQQRREALDTVQTGNKRKEEKIAAKETIVSLKHRVVDLLEIYVKKCPNNPLIIGMVSPLLSGMHITLDKSLGVKIHKLLKNKVCKSKISDTSALDKDELIEKLKEMHKNSLRTSNTNDYNLSTSQCSIFIAKQLVQTDKALIDEIIDLYADLMKQWFKKKNGRLTSSMFFDFINWLNSKRVQN